MSDTRNGAERIADERLRQIMAEGFTAEHDDGHIHGELAMAAACYAAPGGIYDLHPVWPWDGEDKRPDHTPTDDDRIRLLEKAGALIAAEIDRLLRKQGT
jgi:hypothetical protein